MWLGGIHARPTTFRNPGRPPRASLSIDILLILLYGVLQMEIFMAKDQLSDPIALRIPVEVLSAIEEIAETTERSRSWVIVRALKTYLLNEGAEILAFRRGRKEIAEGNSEDLDDVIRDIERIVAGKIA